jgi:hypothetical protein
MSFSRFCHRVAFVWLLSATLSTAVFAQQAPAPAEARPAPLAAQKHLGNEACAKCHTEIYKSYSSTAMAQASGSAMQGMLTGDFVHVPSRVHYRVYAEGGKAWMSFDRPGDNQIQGKKELLYCSTGKMEKARTTIAQVLKFNPDLTSARNLQRQLNADPATCGTR